MKLYWIERDNQTRAVDRLDEVVALPPSAPKVSGNSISPSTVADGVAQADADAFMRAGWSFVPAAPGAGRIKTDANHRAVYLDGGRLYIDGRRLVVRFSPSVSKQRIFNMLADHGLVVERELRFAPNSFEVSPANIVESGSDIVELASEIGREPEVRYATPSFIEAISGRTRDDARLLRGVGKKQRAAT
jgi:hypothetical protein